MYAHTLKLESSNCEGLVNNGSINGFVFLLRINLKRYDTAMGVFVSDENGLFIDELKSRVWLCQQPCIY